MEAAELARRLREVEERERQLEATLASLGALSGFGSAAPSAAATVPSNVLALSVGGRRFVTTRATLTRVPDTFFSALFSGRFATRTDASGAVFIDRAPDHFPLLLEWLRSSQMPDDHDSRLNLLAEADFYGVQPLIHELEDLLDGRAYKAACVAAALEGTCFEAETAARAYFAAKHGSYGKPPPTPPPALNELLLRPFSVKAQGDSFVDTLDDGSTPLILTQHRRVLVPGTRSIVHSKGAFEHQLELFTRGSLNDLEWDGVLLAGGACLAPLLALPPELAAGYGEGSVLADRILGSWQCWRTIQYYHGGSLDIADNHGMPDGAPLFAPYSDNPRSATRSCFQGGDIDLFLYGLTADEAFAKVRHIAEVLEDNGGVSNIFRTQNAITFIRLWPHRHVQIILRMYGSPTDVLSSFDLDCCACGFDGTDVLVLPRARLAINRALNIVDPSRESPTYDTRLWKYSHRGFGVAVPGFTGIVDDTELQRPRAEQGGLARLVRLAHQAGAFPQCQRSFFASKGMQTWGDAAVGERLLEELSSRSDLVAGDAYGDRVPFPYWPYLSWIGNNEIFQPLLRKLLCSVQDPGGTRPLRRELTLRSPAPVLPWLFSRDIEFVLDARDQPRVAFLYKLMELGPDGITSGPVRNVDVSYETSVPLLCTFPAPPATRLLTGSFFAPQGDDGDVAATFYRGMAPSPVMQRRKHCAMDTS